MVLAGGYRSAARALHHWLQLTEKHGSLIKVFVGDSPIQSRVHYPEGDLIDNSSGTQCYYHCHRNDGEHGHIHLFRRQGLGGPPTHLIAISLDARGLPVGLFTVNSWVAEDQWIPANQAIKLLSGVSLYHADCENSLSGWLSHFLRSYRPLVLQLLKERDQQIAKTGLPLQDALQYRELEIASSQTIDWKADLALLDARHPISFACQREV